MPLHLDNAAVLGDASASAIVDALASLADYRDKDRWLGTNNFYRTKTIDGLNKLPIREKHLREYIAASLPIHCIDGWSYLGRALTSLLSGDVGTGRHLAYYAELRASLAILAANGIGVFNSRHFYVEQDGAVSQFPRRGQGTHEFAWNALEGWAGTNDVTALLGNSFSPFGLALSDWLNAVPKYAAWQPVAQAWLLAMGLDLNRLANDRISRNEVSYRPTRLVTPVPFDLQQSARFATELWATLEPADNGPNAADAHLLRRSFEQAFKSVEGVSCRQAKKRFGKAVDDLVGAVLQPGNYRDGVRAFLVRGTSPEDLSILGHAERHSSHESATHPLEVLARASLLLDVATGSCRARLNDANISLSDLEFWWRPIANDHGLMAPEVDLADIEDQWADVADAIDDVGVWMAGGDGTAVSFIKDCGPAMARLGRMEVAPLWRLAA